MRRAFVILFIVIVALDVCPWSVPIVRSVKLPLCRVLSGVGISQGQWAMFAPDPVINNRWITAEMQTKAGGERLQWESPIWSRSTGWEKFVKFRSLNYFNRIVNPANYLAVADLMDYLARNSEEPIEHVQLFRNELILMRPEDGSLTPRDEAEWRLMAQPWLDRQQLK